MSDSRIYELEDIVWDEFGDNDDHIVPQRSLEKHGSVESGSSRRLRHELSYAENNAEKRRGSNNIIQRKEETSLISLKEAKEIMLENGPRLHSCGGVFSTSFDGDSNRKTSCSTAAEVRTSNKCMKISNMDSISADDRILADQTSVVDNNLYHYHLNNASHKENDLDFFGNNLQEKESSDLFHYGWPEMENFEDVDKMFRNFESTFGVELDNGDDLDWFSSSQATEGSNYELETSFNFPGCNTDASNMVTEHQEVVGLNNTCLAANENDKKLTQVISRRGLQKLTPSDPSDVMNSSCANGYGPVTQIDSDPQIPLHVRESKHQKPSEGKRKERSLENGDSFIHYDTLKQVEESNHSLNFQCSLSSKTQQRQETRQETKHQTCLQTMIPSIKSNNDHLSNQSLASQLSSITNTEDSGIPSISLREPSYASNQQSKSSIPVNKEKDGLHRGRLSGYREKTNLMVKRDDFSAQKQIPNFENEVEGKSEVDDVDIGMRGELDSSNIQESFCRGSVVDDVSIEASSFQQLQHVMEQLDIRTKLCIRDSLYRLARSAEQRHKCVKKTNDGRDEKDASGTLISDETNKSTEFMDMETDTNPIDRSIAHLLFHRPSDPSATAAPDVVPTKSHTMVEAPNHGPVTAEKLVCQEESASVNEEAAEL